MQHKTRKIFYSILIVLGVVIIAALFLFVRKEPLSTQVTTSPSPVVSPTQSIAASPTVTKFDSQDIPGISNSYRFSAKLPPHWKIEFIPQIDALNFYDPTSPGTTTLEQSQIFIRNFTSDRFLTLSTVTIHSSVETTVNNRPAVRYEIEKKPGIADFSHQPSWRSKRHFVTDIRTSDNNPALFYVIAQRPDLEENIFNDFLLSLSLLK